MTNQPKLITQHHESALILALYWYGLIWSDKKELTERLLTPMIELHSIKELRKGCFKLCPRLGQQIIQWYTEHRQRTDTKLSKKEREKPFIRELGYFKAEKDLLNI